MFIAEPVLVRELGFPSLAGTAEWFRKDLGVTVSTTAALLVSGKARM